MKQTFLLLITSFAMLLASAQNEKYTKAMQKNLALLDSAFVNKNFTEVANNFERIATAEKNQWLPYYYAAYASLMQVMTSEDKSKSDDVADKAEQLINKAEEIAGKENSETCVIKSMIATTHMLVDPMNRWMKYGKASSENLIRAKELDPKNPRPVFLDGQGKLYTPEAFGGGKAVAKPILEEAVRLFEAFKPETELHPNWGMPAAQKALAVASN